MKKINCWEHKKCGKGPGELKPGEKVCPAAIEARMDGIHGGVRAGRACWIITGVMCESDKKGFFALKYRSLVRTCVDCDFYQRVRNEEGVDFVYAGSLMMELSDRERRFEHRLINSNRRFTD